MAELSDALTKAGKKKAPAGGRGKAKEMSTNLAEPAR